MSALSGMRTTRAIADSVASSCATGRALPSGYPCDHATAALLVAIALAPRLSIRRALPASQAFARIRISGPACKRRNVRARSSLACVIEPPWRRTQCALTARAYLANSGRHHRNRQDARTANEDAQLCAPLVV